MKKSRFTDGQIIEAIKRAEAGLAAPELCRELGISSAAFYKWRAKPQQNAYVERFKRTVRDEWLSQYHWGETVCSTYFWKDLILGR